MLVVTYLPERSIEIIRKVSQSDLSAKFLFYQMNVSIFLFTVIAIYMIIRVRSAFSLVASCVLLKYTRTDDVN